MTDVADCRMFNVRATGRDQSITSLVACDGIYHFLVHQRLINLLYTTLCDGINCLGDDSLLLDASLLDPFAQARADITVTIPEGHFLLVGTPQDTIACDVYTAGDTCTPYERNTGSLQTPTDGPVYLSHFDWSGMNEGTHRGEIIGGEKVTWGFWYKDYVPRFKELGYSRNWLLPRRRQKLEAEFRSL